MDLEPFNRHFPMMSRPSYIGDGVRFLNRQAARSGTRTHFDSLCGGVRHLSRSV